MTSRDLSRTEKPLASIDNIMNSVHVPIYKRRRQTSLRKKSTPFDAKHQLYDFDTEGNENKGKRFKKSQKVRKRARICIRHNKENAYGKGTKTNLNIKNHNYTSPIKNGPRECFQDLIGNVPVKSILKNVQARAVVHNGFSPVDDDILSLTSENCDDLSDNETEFHGFSKEECNNRRKNFFDIYGQKQLNSSSQSNIRHHSLGPAATNPYMTPNPYVTPVKVSSRSSFIPVIEFNESVGGNQLQPNRSSENIDLNHTFQNVSYNGDRYYSTPVKNYSFNSTDSLNFSVNDFNVTNCFGFEDIDHLNEEFHVSPIKDNKKRPLRTKLQPVSGSSQAQPPSVEEIIDRLKEDAENTSVTKPDALYAPDIDFSILLPKKVFPSNTSSLDLIYDDMSNDIGDYPKILKVTETLNEGQNESKLKHVRRSYERPQYMRNRKNSHHEESDVEEHQNADCLNKTKNKKQPKNKKKVGPTKKEVDELEKWAQAFNSQCAQVEAFDLCIE